jgi:hypothetical protein
MTTNTVVEKPEPFGSKLPISHSGQASDVCHSIVAARWRLGSIVMVLSPKRSR